VRFNHDRAARRADCSKSSRVSALGFLVDREADEKSFLIER
jgi:hypothetical protein